MAVNYSPSLKTTRLTASLLGMNAGVSRAYG